MSEKALTALQRGWLLLEQRDTPMHVGVLMYFDKPRGAAETFLTTLAENWATSTQAESPWNLRLHRRRGLALRQAELDIDFHLRQSALPKPGGERELGELVSRLHGKALDLSQPPWECHLIDGLYGRRFALYLKVHLALFSAPGFIALLQRFLAADRKRRHMPPPWELSADAASSTAASLLRDWPAMLSPLLNRTRELLDRTLPWAGIRRAPRSALNDRINSLRRFATQEYEQARLQAVGQKIGASEEELLLYLCSSAVRRFFREYNALPEQPLLALLPDRSRADHQLVPLLVSLGTQHASRERRLQEIQKSLRVNRGLVQGRSQSLARAEASVEVMPFILRQLAGVDHRLQPMFNLGIAQYHFDDAPRFLNGARLSGFFPMPMLLQGSALSIASARYAGRIFVGLCGARDNLPHLQRVAVYMERALVELENEGLHNE